MFVDEEDFVDEKAGADEDFICCGEEKGGCTCDPL
jgi:hypothetical protein